MAGILTALIAALRAIPLLARLFEQVVGLIQDYKESKKAVDASERKTQKDSAVDAAVDGASRVSTPSEAGEQPKTNQKT